MFPCSDITSTSLTINTFRSMTILTTMTLGQTSEVARLANDGNKPHPLGVSSPLRRPTAVKLSLTPQLLTDILQHPSRTLLRRSHLLIASRTTSMLTADLDERQPRKPTVDQSNPLVTCHLLMERYAFRQEKLLKFPITTKMTMTCLTMKRTCSPKPTGLGRRRMHPQSMRCSIIAYARTLVSDAMKQC